MDKISIIIPVYNAEKYIKKCVESILKQDYEPVEIVIVNNNSTDQTENICIELLKENNNVIYLNTKEKGVSAARNYGLQFATGDLIGFCDADDTFEENILSTAIYKMNLHKADICIFGYHEIDENGNKTNNQIKKDKILNFEEFIVEILSDKKCTGCVWNKIFRKELLTDIKFNINLSMMEDAYFNIEVAKRNRGKCIFIPEIGYNYLHSTISVTSNENRKFDGIKLRYMQAINQIKNDFNLTKKENKALRISSAILNSNVFTIRHNVKNKELQKKRITNAKRIFIKNYLPYILSQKITLKEKVIKTILFIVS